MDDIFGPWSAALGRRELHPKNCNSYQLCVPGNVLQLEIESLGFVLHVRMELFKFRSLWKLLATRIPTIPEEFH
jgi:hypothetical protein